MRAWGIRALFAVLLLGALAARIQASHEPAHDIRPAVVELLASRGFAAHIVPAKDDSLLKAVAFDAPQCGGSVQVFPVRLNLQEAPLFDAAIGAGHERHIAYLGRTWRELSRLELRLEWIKHKMLSAAGQGLYTANTTALLIAAPSGCRLAESIDWAPLWHRAPPGS
jgi:hypothetical protein